ncbi:MAG TPA: Mut7-C RNAse domain-containing protein [Nitrospiria bacterium]|nr:Mut7-C RNAse domain-containing protein [Nitrospiria bacterium]
MMRTANPTFRFIADAMLGKLAKWLRILGYDVAYERKIEDVVLINRARVEDRLILTRDAHLIRRRWSPPVSFILIEDDHLPEQLRQLVRELKLSVTDHLLTRCVECNEPLTVLPREETRRRVPPYVYKTQSEFAQCPRCSRIFWQGTHWERIRQRLQAFFPERVAHPTHSEESSHG